MEGTAMKLEFLSVMVRGNAVPGVVEDGVARALTHVEIVLRAEILQREYSITLLKAMVEKMAMKPHRKEFCGTNDCDACEWEAFAQDLGWPPWGKEGT